MERCMPCGPCPGSQDRALYEALCSKCDRTAPGYAESERVAFMRALGSADGLPASPITPIAYWYGKEPCCHNYSTPLADQIAQAQEQLDALLEQRKARGTKEKQ